MIYLRNLRASKAFLKCDMKPAAAYVRDLLTENECLP